jgi:hypothetical protein
MMKRVVGYSSGSWVRRRRPGITEKGEELRRRLGEWVRHICKTPRHRRGQFYDGLFFSASNLGFLSCLPALWRGIRSARSSFREEPCYRSRFCCNSGSPSQVMRIILKISSRRSEARKMWNAPVRLKLGWGLGLALVVGAGLSSLGLLTGCSKKPAPERV